MRATNHKHYSDEQNKANKSKQTKNSRKVVKFSSIGFAIVIAAAAFIVPTTTLAPGVEAYADSRIASYSVGDIDIFSSVIADNCIEVTTAPETEPATVEETTQEPTVAVVEETVEETTVEETEPTEAPEESSKEEEIIEETTAAVEETESEQSDTEATEAETEVAETSDTEASSESESSDSEQTVAYTGGTLIDIDNPDSSYSPSYVSLSSYDRAKLERLVMGEAGTMGYTGAALVAQSIRDAMNRSGTSSIDQIISEYQYFGSTSMEPNEDVKNAVSFIFDDNGAAVQHRVLCFYIGYSAWHETQTFITSIGGVRFFDLNS